MIRPVSKWLAVVLTAMWIPALIGVSALLQTDAFWLVVKWICITVGIIVVIGVLAFVHWGLYKWWRNEDIAVPPLEEHDKGML